MEFPDIILAVVLILSILVIVYSWKNPLYLIPLYVLFLGGIFGQLDLDERLYVQVFEGVRLYLRDFIIVLMLVHIIRARHARKRWKGMVFGGSISLFLLYLLASLLMKFMTYGSDFDGKVTPYVRLFATFAIYYLIVAYLRKDNVLSFVRSCYLLCIASVVMLLGYVLVLIPLPLGLNLIIFPSEVGGSQAIRLGMPNHFFLFFPYFMAIAPLLGFVERSNVLERVTIALMIVGSALTLFRMYLFVVIFGGTAAFLAGRGAAIRKLAVGFVVSFGLFLLIQTISEARESGIAESFIERFAGTGEEFGSEESSGGGRIFRTYVTLGQMLEPGVLLTGTAFTTQFSQAIAFTSGDLGIISTALFYGIPGLIFIILIYTRGLSAASAFLKSEGDLGRISAALLLFMISILPAVIFMYNPLQTEMWIAVWATFLGTFDAVLKYSSPFELRTTAASVSGS